jgi:hypothetical protein
VFFSLLGLLQKELNFTGIESWQFHFFSQTVVMAWQLFAVETDVRNNKKTQLFVTLFLPSPAKLYLRTDRAWGSQSGSDPRSHNWTGMVR